ncbi:MAG: DNA-processing protein DprA [Bacteroidales bacterium]|nr:DNA-processing protein DprA [Candidatus Latescibacterota bacterium]
MAKVMEPGHIVSMLRSRPGRDRLAAMIGRDVNEPPGRILRDRLEFIGKKRQGALAIDDPGYPSILREIGQPPPLIYYAGDPAVLNRPSLCVVGSRRATRKGLLTARQLGSDIAGAGFTVTSGMARGIDSEAHRGALETSGKTTAVLGCGIDVPYPPENASLAVDIARVGCLVSEFHPGTPPQRYHFPMRNRIMSGLSLGVIVVEAGSRSGATGTAGWAADHGREVFAVPGHPTEKGSEGPNRLLKEGAWLVDSSRDIFDIIKPPGHHDPVTGESKEAGLSHARDEMNGEERMIYSALEADPKHVDELVRICHISATSAMSLLTDLELRGLAEAGGNGMWALPEKTVRRIVGGDNWRKTGTKEVKNRKRLL